MRPDRLPLPFLLNVFLKYPPLRTFLNRGSVPIDPDVHLVTRPKPTNLRFLAIAGPLEALIFLLGWTLPLPRLVIRPS